MRVVCGSCYAAALHVQACSPADSSEAGSTITQIDDTVDLTEAELRAIDDLHTFPRGGIEEVQPWPQPTAGALAESGRCSARLRLGCRVSGASWPAS